MTAIIRPHRSTAVYCYRPSSVVCRSLCHTSEPCKNGWTDRDAVWVEDSGGSRESCIRWGPDASMERGNFKGERAPIVKYRNFLPWAVQKRWTELFAVRVGDSGGPKEAQIQVYSPGGANVLSWEGTLAPHGKYDWTIRLRRRCGLISNYFDHLF